MSIVDAFRAETEIPVRFNEFYELVKSSAKADLLMNATNCEVPHIYTREVMTGKKEDIPEERPAAAAGGQEAKPAAGDAVEASFKQTMIFSVNSFRKELQEAEPGSELHIETTDGKRLTAVLIGKSHYNTGDLVFRFSYIGKYKMNKENTNAGGWAASDLRKYLNVDFFQTLPEWLKTLIIPHKVTQKVKKGKDFETVETFDRIFLPSEYELQGANEEAEYNGIDKQFPYFEIRKNRLVFEEDDGGYSTWFWTADPSAADTTDFCGFGTDGGSHLTGAANDGAVAPLFVI